MNLEGIIDIHCHGAPDIRERKMDIRQLASKASLHGMAGFVFKNHHMPTVAITQLINAEFPNLKIYSGIALNYAVGGLNPEAVEFSLKMGASIVWLPTLDAEHERIYRKKPGTGIRIWDSNQKLKPEVRDIIALAKEYNVVLAMGHISAPEILEVLKAGRNYGLQKMLVNHPGIIFQRFSIPTQKSMAGKSTYFERVFARPPHTLDWDTQAQSIKDLGWQDSVLATDLGQIDQVDPVQGMQEMIDAMLKRGISEKALEQMCKINPAYLLAR